jgi:cytidylate kinase
MGSFGNDIALQVAGQLGWQQVCQNLINQAAREAGVPLVALAEIDELGFLGLHPSTKEWRAYQTEVGRIIGQLADGGRVVIVGRGAQVVLRDRPDTVHVRVVAPFELRVLRLQNQEHISEEAAQARLQAYDKARARYLRRNHGVAVDDPTLYHVIINTGLLNAAQAVNLIVTTYQLLNLSDSSV